MRAVRGGAHALPVCPFANLRWCGDPDGLGNQLATPSSAMSLLIIQKACRSVSNAQRTSAPPFHHL